MTKKTCGHKRKPLKTLLFMGKIVIDKADLKKQIDSIAGESSKFGNKFKIKYGVDKGDFVKQFRVAGEEAKKQIDKVLSGSGSPVKN